MNLTPLLSVLFALVFNACSANESPASTKPAIIMVPGAFHVPQVFDKVAQLLRQDDFFFLEAVALPSVGHVVGRQADIDAVKDVLYKYLDAGRDVVLVGNSYGCTVIGEAVQHAPHYSSSTSPYPTPHGRIISLIYLAGYIPTISEVTNPTSRPDIHTVAAPFFNFHDANGTVTPDADPATLPPQKTFYNLLPAGEADFWTAKLEFSAFEALNDTATYIPYAGDFEVVYVAGEQDNAVPPAFAKQLIGQEGAMFEVEWIDADHISMLSRPGEVVRVIRKYAVPPGQYGVQR